MTSQINPDHAILTISFNVYFHISLQFTPNSSTQSNYFRFPNQNPKTSSSPLACRMPRPAHSLYLITQIIFGQAPQCAVYTNLL